MPIYFIAMMTFSRGRNTVGEQKAEALNRVVAVLLQGIALHGFQFESLAFEKFQTGIRKLRADFEEAEDQDTALLLAAAAIRLMEDHNNAAERHLQIRQNENEALIALLSESLFSVTDASPEAMMRVKEIERDFSVAPRAEEMQSARLRLSDYLMELREHMRGNSTLKRHTAGETDSVTGLPDSGYAEDAIASVWNRRHDYYAAIFALERLETINVRFGFKSGDEILLILSQHVAQSIPANDQLFRWRGPCLVALMERKVHEALITSELTRISSARLEHAIRMKDREVMVPISTTWNLVPLGSIASVEDVVSSLNDFAANRTRHLR